MHHNDPARPRLGGLPLLLAPDGSFYQTVIPAISVSLRPDNTYDLWGFFPGSTPQHSSPKFCKCTSLQEVSERLAEWFEDPEGFAIRHMGWIPPALTAKPTLAPAPVKAEISLDDIEF